MYILYYYVRIYLFIYIFLEYGETTSLSSISRGWIRQPDMMSLHYSPDRKIGRLGDPAMCYRMSIGRLEAGWWWLEHGFYEFPFSWEFHNPDWRTHIFQRGRSTTNQEGSPWSVERLIVLGRLHLFYLRLLMAVGALFGGWLGCRRSLRNFLDPSKMALCFGIDW